MANNNTQEPIEKEGIIAPEKKIEEKPVLKAEPEKEKIPSAEKEAPKEATPEKVSEKIETTRKTIQSQKPTSAAAVQDDAQTVAAISEYEKKVEKLVEIALHKGPEHSIRVAQHMDKNDNYTLDELHDKLIESDLRKQLIQKGLLKEL